MGIPFPSSYLFRLHTQWEMRMVGITPPSSPIYKRTVCEKDVSDGKIHSAAH